jgi:hypothetical protein
MSNLIYLSGNLLGANEGPVYSTVHTPGYFHKQLRKF